jgi:hypothetical protein
MWHHVFENTFPALAGAGVVGLIFALNKQRSAAWIALMVLMFTLIEASTQIIWELSPQWRHGWEHFIIIILVAAVFGILFSPLMQRFCKKDDHNA